MVSSSWKVAKAIRSWYTTAIYTPSVTRGTIETPGFASNRRPWSARDAWRRHLAAAPCYSLTAATTTLNSTTSSNVFRRPAAARRRNCYEVVAAKMMRKTKYDIKNFEEKCKSLTSKWYQILFYFILINTNTYLSNHGWSLRALNLNHQQWLLQYYRKVPRNVHKTTLLVKS